MIKYRKYLHSDPKRNRIISHLSIFFLLSIAGCLTAGTHGSIASYTFNLPKPILQKKVNEVIASSKNIQIAPITDSFASKEYNDGERYMTIIISKGDQRNRYIFQYTGSNESWDTAKTSEISIAYAYDKEGNGGSEGGGDFPFYKFRLKGQLVNTFKSELIDIVDSALDTRHH